MQEPFPHQGTVSTQQQNPDNPGKNNHEIYMVREEMFFQTWNRSYDTPPDTSTSGASMSTPTAPLTIPNIPLEPLAKMVKGPNRRAGNYSKAAHNYSIVDDLSQSPTAMSTLEVLQSCPKQWKALLSALGIVDLANTHMMDFDLDKSTPRFPSMVAFHIPVSV